ncbi:MAG: radical SAM protein [Deltaproteobacteria bacterium]|nr:radical SAM protein [Deltaproteobacteria bacterium]
MADTVEWSPAEALQNAMASAYRRSGRPGIVQIDITYRCDLNCVHCVLDNRTTWPEMTTAEWLDVFAQLAELGVWRINFSGGEAFLRPDMVELLDRARKMGFRLGVRSHFGNIDAELAQKLRALNLTHLRTTVYSLDPAIHDAFTRRPGSLVATLAGVEHLRVAGVPVVVDCVLQGNTIEEIPAIHQYFASRKCTINFGTNIYRDHMGSTDLDLMDLTASERVRARQLIWTVVKDDTDIHSTVKDAVDQPPCGAGRTQFYISPDGSVWPCVMFPMQIGHLREHRLVDIWENSPERRQLVAFTNRDRGECQSCSGSDVCFYCPGEAYKHSGDFRKAPDHFHSRTRDHMRGLELARGPRYSEQEWASVPDPVRPKRDRPGKFVFPIYRPQKGRGTRVGEVR